MPFEGTDQIFTLVNETASQAMGQSAIKVVDTSSLVALGNAVLNSNQNVEAFVNTLFQRIGKQIFSFRAYRNKLKSMVISDFEFGAILQKIKVSMPEAEADDTFDLQDGQSVDMYKVSKPVVHQKLFVKRTPYRFRVTIQKKTLKEAFLSAEAMDTFIGQILGEVRNKIEVALENLGRATLANFIAESSHEVKLLTQYNALTTGATPLTPTSALLDNGFLRWAIGVMKTYMKGMSDMSTMYNDGTETRHTPYELQRMKVLASFETALETQVQYAAFNQDYVKLVGFEDLNFWQSEQTPGSIMVKRASDQTDVTVENIVAVLHDRDALGIYQKDEEVNTTPLNAAARYYNTFWHEQQMWFNDLSENFVFFTLN